MYIQEKAIKELETLYGVPQEITVEQEITLPEMRMLKASQKNGRAHDFTFFIIDNEDRVAVIRKHSHPPGFYRAPSGGINPGEDLLRGMLREALEETGVEIRFERYILRIKARFKCNETSVFWVSHIFTAVPLSTLLCPLDTDEIKEAKWVSWEELQGPIRENLRNSPLKLFHYRVVLTDAVRRLLRQ